MSQRKTPIAKRKMDTSPEEVQKYWTKDKMRKAKPAKMPKVNDLDRGKEQPQSPSV